MIAVTGVLRMNDELDFVDTRRNRDLYKTANTKPGLDGGLVLMSLVVSLLLLAAGGYFIYEAASLDIPKNWIENSESRGAYLVKLADRSNKYTIGGILAGCGALVWVGTMIVAHLKK